MYETGMKECVGWVVWVCDCDCEWVCVSAIGGVYGWVMKGREEVAVSCFVLVSPQQPTPDCEGMPDTTQAVSLTLAGYLFLVVPLSQRRKTKTLLFVDVVDVAFSFRCSPLNIMLLTLPTHSSVQVCIKAPCSRFFLCPTSPSTQTQQAGAKILTQRTSYGQVCKDCKPHRSKEGKTGHRWFVKKKKKAEPESPQQQAPVVAAMLSVCAEAGFDGCVSG